MPVNLLAILLLVGSSAPGLQNSEKKRATPSRNRSSKHFIQTSFHHTNVKYSSRL
jgi:hypothetical protein